MNARLEDRDNLPDVAEDARAASASALAWVGMEGFHAPLQLAGVDPASVRCGMATVHAWVNLPAGGKRGIHMSRLYGEAEAMLAGQALNGARLQELLQGFLASHAGISSQARVQLAFDVLAKRRALLSDATGWKVYPCRVDARMVDGSMQLELECRIGYSSTCPASAALSRQLAQQRFLETFPAGALDREAVAEWLGTEAGMPATPHGQRSEASVRVQLEPTAELPVMALVDQVEGALKTPLQTAVKRRDEQEFARLNGENLLFCEDAARRIHAALDGDERYRDFAAHCAHFESLHPHDAVATAVKGVADGYDD